MILFVASTIISVGRKIRIFYVKKKYGIVFQGKENTFIEVTGKEIRKYLNSPIPVEQKKALQNLMIHSWI